MTTEQVQVPLFIPVQAPEKLLAALGKQVLNPGAMWVLGTAFLLAALYLAVRLYRHHQQAGVREDAKVWQGNEGLVLIFVVVSLVSIGIGIISLAIYAHMGFQNDFSQSSGSLVQAIWGSSA